MSNTNTTQHINNAPTPTPQQARGNAPTPTPQQSQGKGRGGFTLIEVLIASIILALGTLGLLVLFAGAAQQQREASEVTSSIIASSTAGAILERRFANIDGRFITSSSTNLIDNISDGAWYVIPTVDNRNDDDFGTISIDPGDSGDLFFVLSQPDPVPLYAPSTRDGSLNGRGSFDDALNGTDSIFNEDTIRKLPHRRIEPDSAGVIRVITDDAPTVAPSAQIGERAIFYFRVDRDDVPATAVQSINTWQADSPANNGVIDNDSPFHLYTRNGQPLAVGDRDHIVMDLQSDDASIAGDFNARLRAFYIEPVATDSTRVITDISISPYTYRESAAISLADRVKLDAQGNPSLAYSLLFRSQEDSIPEVGVFTYAIRSDRRGNAFRPDESINDNPTSSDFGRPNDEAPLRLIDADIAYDEDFEQYYLTVDNNNDVFAIQPGQIVLIARGPDNVVTPSGTFDFKGSDIAVNVLGLRNIDGETRGYIDRVPRSLCKPVLPDRDDTADIEILVVQQRITDVDGNRWILEPRAFDVFPIER